MAARSSARKGRELATAVHVPVDDLYVAFPAGAKVGDKVTVNGEQVELTAELAEKITNPKAWVDDSESSADAEGEA
jgi:hypothetical protein